MGFVISPRPKCDIILSQEEYDMVMQHRAIKRLMPADNHVKHLHLER